jgi:hypothetical protein
VKLLKQAERFASQRRISPLQNHTSSGTGKRNNLNGREVGLHKKGKRVVSLDKLPIESSDFEKRLVEENQWAYQEYLLERAGCAWLGVPPGVMERRISEVYRLAYTEKRRLDVINDFAAHFPHLVFSSAWVAELVNQERRMWGFKILYNRSKRDALLQSIARGLLRASNSDRRIRRSLQYGRLQAAKVFRERICRQLGEFIHTIDPKQLASEENNSELSRLIPEQIEELVDQNPRLAQLREKLKSLLRQRKIYRASLVITAKLFGVSLHKLEHNRSNRN